VLRQVPSNRGKLAADASSFPAAAVRPSIDAIGGIMRHPFVPLLVATLLAPVLGAQEKSDAGGDRKAQVAAVQHEFEKAQRDVFARYQKAKDDAERDAIVQRLPKPEAFAQKLWPLVDAAPADEASGTALVWIVNSVVGRDRQKACALLLAHHLARPEIGDMLQSLVYEPTAANLAFLERVAKDAASAEVKGKARFAQAQLCTQIVESAERLGSGAADEQKSLAEQLGAEQVAWLRNVDRKAFAANAEKLFDQVVAEHADVPMYDSTLGDLAKSELFEVRNLGIGKVAPDIVGKDADGVPFQLSDYRGKVVVLDFWGEW